MWAMRQPLNSVLAKVFQRLHYLFDMNLAFVRWYTVYPRSLRHIEEMMAERDVSVGRSIVRRRIDGPSSACWCSKRLYVGASGQ